MKTYKPCGCPVIIENSELVRQRPELSSHLLIAGGGTNMGQNYCWVWGTCMTCHKQHKLDVRIIR